MPQSDLDLVLADLRDAFKALDQARPSPKQVRQTFSRFVELTQRLTAVMRRESKKSAGIKWEASKFAGWSEVTTLFKDLRNEEQHERQIRILVHETRYFEPLGPEGERIGVSGTWDLTDQLAENPPDGLRLLEADPVTGAPTDNHIPHCDVLYRYLIKPSDGALALRLGRIGTADVHDLSRRLPDHTGKLPCVLLSASRRR